MAVSAGKADIQMADAQNDQAKQVEQIDLLLSKGVDVLAVNAVDPKAAATIMAKAANNNVVPPDLITVDGKTVDIVSASWVPSKFRPGVSQLIDQKDLKRIIVRSGHPAHATKTLQYLVKGTGAFTVKYASVKGGTVQTTITLQ
jgi:hypothetical protein